MAGSFFHNTPPLETERLFLRKLTPADAEDIFAYASDDQITRYLTWDTHGSLENTLGFIYYTLSRYERDEAGDWGIVVKATGKLVGTIGFVKSDRINHYGEIGYVLSRNYWGQGIMPEAAAEVIRFAFEVMGLNRVESCHFLPNEKSGRVMQKVGMTCEGIAREKMFAKGQFWDMKQYAILYRDWKQWVMG